MSTSLPDSKFKFCSFDPSFHTRIKYICLKDEKCCPPGCCVTFSLSKLRSFLSWALLLVVLIFFYWISKYCKNIRKITIPDRRRRIAVSENGDQNRVRVRERLETCEENQSPFSANINENEFPPKYNEALLMPKLNHKLKNNTDLHESNENQMLPSYDDATQNKTCKDVIVK